MTEVQHLKRQVEMARLVLDCIEVISDNRNIKAIANATWAELGNEYDSGPDGLLGAVRKEGEQ